MVLIQGRTWSVAVESQRFCSALSVQKHSPAPLGVWSELLQGGDSTNRSSLHQLQVQSSLVSEIFFFFNRTLDIPLLQSSVKLHLFFYFNVNPL